MTQIVVILPDGLVRELDQLVAQGHFANRSSAVRRAVELIVAGQRRDALEAAYANGDRQAPESESELAEANIGTEPSIREWRDGTLLYGSSHPVRRRQWFPLLRWRITAR